MVEQSRRRSREGKQMGIISRGKSASNWRWKESGRGGGPRKSDYYDWGEVFICLGKLENKAKRGRGTIDNW